MSAVAFDTLKFAQTLRDKAHVPQEQAEGIAEAFADALDDEMVTKTYLDHRLHVTKAELEARIDITKADLEARIDVTKADLEARLEATKADILKWMFGTIGFQTIVILGAVLALSRFGR